MKQTIKAILVGFAVITTHICLADDNRLEPCIHGDVSRTGLFENQEAEDRYFESQAKAAELMAEPWISGEAPDEVSPEAGNSKNQHSMPEVLGKRDTQVGVAAE